MSGEILHGEGRAWNMPLEPVPGRFAPAHEVADYLYDVVEGAGLIWDQDETEFRSLSPAQAKRYCDHHKHPWKQVSPLLRQKRAVELVRRFQENGVTRTTTTGVVINQSVTDALEAAGWLPQCPTFWSGFHRADYHVFTTGGPCRKWWCPDCGPEKLAIVLSQVRRHLAGLTAVHTAVADWVPALAGRMRHRWHGRGAGVFWYRRSDGRVSYVSTVSLAPRRAGEEPVEWTERHPEEAIQWLAEAMVFPGYIDHDWAGSWRPAKEKTKDHLDLDDDTTPQWRWFQLTKAEADMVHGLLEVKVLESCGAELDDVSETLRPDVDALLDDLVKRVRAERYGRGGHEPEL